MKISLSKISQVLPEFVDTRLMPSAPSTMKWILGGSTFLILHQADTLIGKYLPMLKQVGIVDNNNKHKLLEAVEKLNKESYHSAEDIRKYKDAYKAIYYLLSIEKANK